MAQPDALRRALDEAGDVGQHKAGVAVLDDAQVRLQGGEVVVGDLRPRRRHHGQDRGLAHVREAHQAHVRDGLQLQRQLDHVPLLPGLGKLGRLARGRGKVLVAEAAIAALHQRLARAGLVQVQQQLARGLLPHHRSRGHLDHHRLAGLARAPVGHAVAAVFGGELALVAEVHQRVHPLGGLEDHIAAAPAVAAVRAAGLHEFLPVEGHAAVASVPRLDRYAHYIYE